MIAATNVWSVLVEHSEGFAAIESIITCLAILAAGVWALLHYNRKRERFPSAMMVHSVQVWVVSANHRLLRVTLTVSNQSECVLRFFEGHTWIQAMKPWPSEVLNRFISDKVVVEDDHIEIPWPLIKEKNFNQEKEIEPKEADEVTMDFLIDKGYEKVLVYSYIKNDTKPGRNLGWSTSTVIDLTDSGEAQPETQKPLPISAPSESGQTPAKARPSESTHPKRT